MYSDGQSITYRSDQARKGGIRRYEAGAARSEELGLPPTKGAAATAVRTETRPSRPADLAGELSEGLGKLRVMADRLEQGLLRLESVVGNLVTRAAGPQPRSVVQQEEAPTVHLLHMETISDTPSDAWQSDSEPVTERRSPSVMPEVKVSMFTGGEAMAILGHVRVVSDEE